jgi:hypothetical protein
VQALVADRNVAELELRAIEMTAEIEALKAEIEEMVKR